MQQTKYRKRVSPLPLLPSPDLYGPATLALTLGFTAFQNYLPKLSEVRRATPDTAPDVAADVRVGEIAASVVTIGAGLIASSLTGSPLPTFIAGIVCIALIALYESTLQARNPGVPIVKEA